MRNSDSGCVTGGLGEALHFRRVDPVTSALPAETTKRRDRRRRRNRAGASPSPARRRRGSRGAKAHPDLVALGCLCFCAFIRGCTDASLARWFGKRRIGGSAPRTACPTVGQPRRPVACAAPPVPGRILRFPARTGMRMRPEEVCPPR